MLVLYAAGEKPCGGKNPSDFAKELENTGKKAQYFSGSIEESAQKILQLLKSDDLVFTLGAGDITKMGGVLNELYMLKK